MKLSQQENQQVSNDLGMAVKVGLDTLSSEDVRIPTKDIEALAMLKGLLRQLLNGDLVIASPDRVLPAGAQLPEDKGKDKDEQDGDQS